MEKYYFVVTTNGVINCYEKFGKAIDIKFDKLVYQSFDLYEPNINDFWTKILLKDELLDLNISYEPEIGIDEYCQTFHGWFNTDEADWNNHNLFFEFGYNFNSNINTQFVQFIKLSLA